MSDSEWTRRQLAAEAVTAAAATNGEWECDSATTVHEKNQAKKRNKNNNKKTESTEKRATAAAQHTWFLVICFIRAMFIG